MITFKYNLFVDIYNSFITIKEYRWLKKHKLIFFLPNPFLMLKLIFNRPKPLLIDTGDMDIVCYWVSSGTWGSYQPPNKIFICPWNIPDMEEIIKHEIKHLKYEYKVKNMSHEDKEDFIDSIK